MFARAFFGGRFFGPRYFGDGGEIAAAVAETPSGGWRRRHLPPGLRQREQTAEEIHADRVRLGILPPDYIHTDITNSGINSDTTGDIANAGNMVGPNPLAAHLLPEDLAGLEALAARAAQLTIDHEIALWLKLDEQRRLHEEWLRDEDDAAVLLLAIATIH